MYKGFNLSLTSSAHFDTSSKTILYEDSIKMTIEKYINTSGSLDASKMQEDWFPTVHADIFISHSHSDVELARKLAGWLHKEFGLNAFVDSTVWGYANELLKLLDKKYCYNKERNTYNYDKRNISTSHVHLLLNTAILQMMDKAECLFFLNTPSSIMPSQQISSPNGATGSPWIYSELSISKHLRTRPPERLSSRSHAMDLTAELAEHNMLVSYPAELNHLIDIDFETLMNWKRERPRSKHGANALDTLYWMKQEVR